MSKFNCYLAQKLHKSVETSRITTLHYCSLLGILSREILVQTFTQRLLIVSMYAFMWSWESLVTTTACLQFKASEPIGFWRLGVSEADYECCWALTSSGVETEEPLASSLLPPLSLTLPSVQAGSGQAALGSMRKSLWLQYCKMLSLLSSESSCQRWEIAVETSGRGTSPVQTIPCSISRSTVCL